MNYKHVCIFLLALITSRAYGYLDTLHVDTLDKTYNINGIVKYYIDDTGELSLKDIRNLDSSSFQTTEGSDLRHDLSEAHIWLTFVLQGDLPQDEELVLMFNDPTIYSIKLYQIQDGNINVYNSGLGVPPDQKAIEGNKNSFLIKLPPGKQQVIFIEFYSKTSITISGSLQAEQDYVVEHTNEQVLFGIFYGIVMLLMLYGFLLFATTRSLVFLYFGFYAFSVAGFTSVADGFMSQYFFWFVKLTNGYQDIFFFAFTNVMGLFLMKAFLNISSWSKKHERLINIYAIMLPICVALLFLISKPLMLAVVQLLGFTTLIIYLLYGVLAYKQNISQAKYYLVAYLAFGVFITIFILSQFRIIPFSALVQYSIHMGYAVSMVILSYGLSQRINSIYQSLLIKEKEKKDIIEQKNKELEVKVAERTADIAQKEVNLRSILENNDNAIWLVDDQYKLIDFNKYFSESWKSVYGTTLTLGANIIDSMPVELQKKQWKTRYNTGLTGKSVTYIDHYELEEEPHYFEIKGFPIGKGNDINGVAFFAKDITKRLKSEKQLKTQNKMLKKVNKELDSFVYSASHDLKAPLASVLGLINLVKSENNLKTRLEYYEMMEKSVVRLDQFIKDIIDYSRNERTGVDLKEVDLQELIDSIFADLKYLNGSEEIKKNISIKAEEPLITDPIRLKVAIRNLISNAIRYGCANSKEKVIELRALVNHDQLSLYIRDYGPGIPEGHLNNIFDMFYRAHEMSSGTGLGLYIVKETISKLKGKIQVEAQMYPGAQFSIIIPNRHKSASQSTKLNKAFWVKQ